MAVTDQDLVSKRKKQYDSCAARPNRAEAVRENYSSRDGRRASDLWLMLLLLALSGNPVFSTPEINRVLISILSVVLGICVFGRKKRAKEYRAVPILAAFGIIVTAQAVHFMFFPAFTLLGLFCRLAVAYEFVSLISDFVGTYIRAVLILSVMAMIFFFANLAGSAVGVNIADATRHIALPVETNTGAWTFLLHTYSDNPTDSTRNAGMFWEPGAFAGYLNIALVFLCSRRSQFTKKSFYRQFAVLSVCLLTTQSTLGYVAFAFVILLAWLSVPAAKFRLRVGTMTAVACILAAFVIFATRQNFMLPKIENSILQTTTETGSWQADRLGSLIFDLTYISARPLTGWGISDDTRLMLDPDLQGNALIGRGNGMSDFAAKFGVPALLAWLYCVYRVLLSLSSGRKMLAVVGLAVILITLNDECFLNYPLFLSFFFLPRLFTGRLFRVRAHPEEL